MDVAQSTKVETGARSRNSGLEGFGRDIDGLGGRGIGSRPPQEGPDDGSVETDAVAVS